jgi:hypothetical protein
MDAWAKALDALITCAPGNEAEIAQVLSAASRKLFVSGRTLRISNLQVRAVQRLVTASNIDADIAFDIEQQVRHGECGFRDRTAAGETAQPDPAGHKASSASPDHPDQWAIRPIPTGEASPLAFRDPARQQFRPLPSDGATHGPAHLPAPPASRLAQS